MGETVIKMSNIDQSGFTQAMEKYLTDMINTTGSKMRKDPNNKAIESRIDAFSEALMFLVTNRRDQ